jgi:hypothetical protein
MLIDGRNSENKGQVEEMHGANIGSWCVSEIKDFSFLFSPDRVERSGLLDGDHLMNFDEDISAWDVSSATTFDSMFFKLQHLTRTLRHGTRPA